MSGATTWLMKRNCSCGPGQLALVFLSLVVLSFAIGVAFAAHGLWMILPFVGLELVAVAVAFVCYGRRAADYERVVLSGEDLRIERVDAGRREEFRVNPLWARVELNGSEPGPVRVAVRSGLRSIEIGRHLTGAARLRLAQELKAALRTRSASAAA